MTANLPKRFEKRSFHSHVGESYECKNRDSPIKGEI